MNGKSTYIIVFIALIVVGGAFYFYNSPKTSEVEENHDNTQVESVATSTEYKNTQYGFKVSLPESWKGYTVVVDNWEGYSLTNNGESQEISETGPLLYVRHPGWTSNNPRQDIPVMVFTYKQWTDL